ncbi:hypothetical protein ACJ3XI_03810 [Litorimonas sp. RW-G-Af-16]|uniref:hypothetical protein n=1 Tax=Litorimonas sp. RW-G-Af-16 TaxID=3241168 RepID=UPI00390C5F0E
MSDPLKKTYADYLGLGYQVVASYFADGHHFQVLQSNEDVVIAHMPHGKIMADGFLSDSDVQITRIMK